MSVDIVQLNDIDYSKINWMDEKIEKVPSNKFAFKLLKFFIKDLTYKKLYILYTYIYDFKENDMLEVKRKAMQVLLNLYKYNHGTYPENVF